jgi:hypothetical protein
MSCTFLTSLLGVLVDGSVDIAVAIVVLLTVRRTGVEIIGLSGKFRMRYGENILRFRANNDHFAT